VFKQGTNLVYQYGPKLSKPDLHLVSDEKSVVLEPWNGVGSSFWNSMTFQNQEYSYVVSSSYNRMEEKLESVGVRILKGDQSIANVECRLDTGLVDNLADFVQRQ
jgi:hypothetical protein